MSAGLIARTLSLGLALAAAPAAGDRPAQVPIVPGVRFVLAVNNQVPGVEEKGILYGDYEMVVAITGVTAESIAHAAFLDGDDQSGVRRRVTVPRMVSAADLASSNIQVLGFHSEDPPAVSGTTSLGPSRGVIRNLVQSGETAYSFLNFASHGIVSGTLRRSPTPVKFPVLLNGRRVELDAIHATGQMTLSRVSRPFETVLLDHPKYPLSLRIAYGPRGGGFPFTPEFAREIVRIDVPEDVPARTSAADTLARECRLEVPGIYFDFNKATLRPESRRGLEDMAAVLRQLDGRPFVVEGHTDNVGSDSYNDDLSARRPAAVRTALVTDFGIAPPKLTTAGFGERRPLESNDTMAGRARNRRVELVCAGR